MGVFREALRLEVVYNTCIRLYVSLRLPEFLSSLDTFSIKFELCVLGIEFCILGIASLQTHSHIVESGVT